MQINDKQARDAQIKTNAHALMLVGRENMDISGVREVLSFDEGGAVMNTVEGELTVEGSGIKVSELNSSSGSLTLSGRIDAVYYSSDAPERKRSLFGRLFG